MARPGKAPDVIEQEGKSHRTKAEMSARRSAAMLTGQKIKERSEVKENSAAHTEFLRVVKLLGKIGKNDALLESIINRYCTLQAECYDFEKKREKFSENLDSLMDDDEMDSDKKYTLEVKMQQSIINVDKQLQSKRKMLFDIEKENGMTISAALRTIPAKTDDSENELIKALSGG